VPFPLALPVLRALDRVFPPNSSAYMTHDAVAAHEAVKAAHTMGPRLAQLGATDLDVLDFGCGWGGETIWLAPRVKSVVGADIEASAIETAKRALARDGATNCRFVQMPDGRIPCPDASFDAALSTDTFEHVMDLDRAFGEIFRVLRPGGRLLTSFGPLFYSPFGYHLYWACAVPYAHLLFGLPAILTLRNERAPVATQATNWQQMGLNGYRFDDYKAAAIRAGFELEVFEAVPVKQMRMLTLVPLLRDLFIFGVSATLRKPSAPSSAPPRSPRPRSHRPPAAA
jgi:SAM-dependent methyltransferase